MQELALGVYGLPLVVSLLLRWLYSVIGEEKITNRMKQVIPVFLGISLSYLYLWYSHLDWSVVNIVDKTFYGIINLGFSAIGFYEVTKTKKEMM